MSFLYALLIVGGTLGWLGILLVSLTNWDEYPRQAATGFVVCFLVAVWIIALIIDQEKSDHLCARGHQTYQLVGKIMEKVWVCEEDPK